MRVESIFEYRVRVDPEIHYPEYCEPPAAYQIWHRSRFGEEISEAAIVNCRKGQLKPLLLLKKLDSSSIEIGRDETWEGGSKTDYSFRPGKFVIFSKN